MLRLRALVPLLALLLVLLRGLTPPARGVAQPPAEPPRTTPLVVPYGPRTPAEEKKGFHLPPGFEAQLVASEPDIGKPINLAFDAHGRLWATCSVEYPFPSPPNRQGRDGVYVLDDIGPDGKAKSVKRYAGGLNIPVGLLPRRDRSVIVYSIPQIERISEGGKVRQKLYGDFGHRDTHGMTGSFTLGFDGWIYANHGFSNTSVVKGSDGQAITMNSGNVYRMRPDGSHCEYFTHGQVNPFGMCFDSLGNLYNVDCHSRPITQLLRGAYYSSFGKPNDGLGFGPNMMGHQHGSTGLCGLVYYTADQFPPEYLNTTFLGNCVTSRINFDRIEFTGSTPRAVLQPDFMFSDDLWYRPVFILLGPDGALYVADFYNKIIGHYEVPLTHPGRDHTHGRIWRIVWKGKDGKAPPPKAPIEDFTKASQKDLVQALAHPNLTVRMMAMHELVDRGPSSVPAVKELMAPTSKPTQRMHGMWILERLGALDDATLLALTKDKVAGVRVHAARVLAERPKPTDEQSKRLIEMLKDPDALVERCAADALGRHGYRADVIRALMALRKRVPSGDSHLLHVVRMALRDQLKQLDRNDVMVQFPSDGWEYIGDVALGIPSKFGATLVLMTINHTGMKATPQFPRQLEHIARYNAEIGKRLWKLVEGITDREPTTYQAQLMQATLRGLQAGGARPDAPTTEFVARLCGQLFKKANAANVRAGIALALALKEPTLSGDLLKVSANRKLSESERADALAAVATIDPAKAVAPLARVLANASESIVLRERAAQSLASLNKPAANAELLKVLPTAEARLASSIAAGLAGTSGGAVQLLDTVKAGKASARLLQEQAVLQRLRQAKVPRLKERLAALTKGLPPADQHIAQLILKQRTAFLKAKPDIVRGEKLFQQHCAACHQIAGKGTKVGPQLDGIGNRGPDRLLEDILDPNRNVDQAFRATRLDLKDGRVVTGLVLREEGQVVVLADAQGKEARVEKGQIDTRTVTTLSPMPANFDQQIPEADLSHLLGYLLTQRAADKK